MTTTLPDRVGDASSDSTFAVNLSTVNVLHEAAGRLLTTILSTIFKGSDDDTVYFPGRWSFTSSIPQSDPVSYEKIWIAADIDPSKLLRPHNSTHKTEYVGLGHYDLAASVLPVPEKEAKALSASQPSEIVDTPNGSKTQLSLEEIVQILQSFSQLSQQWLLNRHDINVSITWSDAETLVCGYKIDGKQRYTKITVPSIIKDMMVPIESEVKMDTKCYNTCISICQASILFQLVVFNVYECDMFNLFHDEKSNERSSVLKGILPIFEQISKTFVSTINASFFLSERNGLRTTITNQSNQLDNQVRRITQLEMDLENSEAESKRFSNAFMILYESIQKASRCMDDPSLTAVNITTDVSKLSIHQISAIERAASNFRHTFGTVPKTEKEIDATLKEKLVERKNDPVLPPGEYELDVEGLRAKNKEKAINTLIVPTMNIHETAEYIKSKSNPTQPGKKLLEDPTIHTVRKTEKELFGAEYM